MPEDHTDLVVGRICFAVQADLDSACVQLFVLYLKANLENISKVSLPEGYEYCIDVSQSPDSKPNNGVKVLQVQQMIAIYQ